MLYRKPFCFGVYDLLKLVELLDKELSVYDFLLVTIHLRDMLLVKTEYVL